jgi:hypothetical protein
MPDLPENSGRRGISGAHGLAICQELTRRWN